VFTVRSDIGEHTIRALYLVIDAAAELDLLAVVDQYFIDGSIGMRFEALQRIQKFAHFVQRGERVRLDCRGFGLSALLLLGHCERPGTEQRCCQHCQSDSVLHQHSLSLLIE
jgi:hypothetical protein